MGFPKTLIKNEKGYVVTKSARGELELESLIKQGYVDPKEEKSKKTTNKKKKKA